MYGADLSLPHCHNMLLVRASQEEEQKRKVKTGMQGVESSSSSSTRNGDEDSGLVDLVRCPRHLREAWGLHDLFCLPPHAGAAPS